MPIKRSPGIFRLFLIFSILALLVGCSRGSHHDSVATDSDTRGTGEEITSPAIIEQPRDKSVPLNLEAIFTVTASGGGLSYQWERSDDNGTTWSPVIGATAASYSITSTAKLIARFRCTVMNTAGSVTTDAAKLTVGMGVVLNKNSTSLLVGSTDQLTATVEPAGVSNTNVTWSTSDAKIASVSGSGLVKAMGAGTATITVKTEEGVFTATCTVRVAPVFTAVTGNGNPFSTVDLGSVKYDDEFVTTALGDLDGDGDLDLVTGALDGIKYHRNDSTATSYKFTRRTGTYNPFNNYNIARTKYIYCTIALGDMDGDGDLDALIGDVDGYISYYRNTGTRTSPSFTNETNTSYPFNAGLEAVRAVGYSSACLGDLDGDGDLDVLIAGSTQMGYTTDFSYYRNEGTAQIPLFIKVNSEENPFNYLVGLERPIPALGDVDGDGDLDALIGDVDGYISYYRNTGTASNPVFSTVPESGNPFKGIDVGDHSTPCLGDMDKDGDLDLIVGEWSFSDKINYFSNYSKLPSVPTLDPVIIQ